MKAGDHVIAILAGIGAVVGVGLSAMAFIGGLVAFAKFLL